MFGAYFVLVRVVGGAHMQEYLRISIIFDGRTAANGIIDFYDVQRALYGFQRSLALTTHLAINNEIITQAPALRNAEILALPAELGSWKFTALIASTLASGIYTTGSASTDTPLGHLVSSIYDYTLNKTFGIDLDYEKTIRQLIAERDLSVGSIPTPEQLNSLAEKTQNSIVDMHRPIEKGSASKAEIKAHKGPRLVKVGPDMNHATLDAARDEIEGDSIAKFRGRVSSYNMNTFTGRLYIPGQHRTIPFELGRNSRDRTLVRQISRSLDENIAGLPDVEGNIELEGLYYVTRSGDLAKIVVTNVRRIQSPQ